MAVAFYLFFHDYDILDFVKVSTRQANMANSNLECQLFAVFSHASGMALWMAMFAQQSDYVKMQSLPVIDTLHGGGTEKAKIGQLQPMTLLP